VQARRRLRPSRRQRRHGRSSRYHTFHVKARYDMVTVFAVRPDPPGTSHEFLQLRREKNDFMGATWQTVRGCAETGETAWQAALRELKEETDLVPDEF